MVYVSGATREDLARMAPGIVSEKARFNGAVELAISLIGRQANTSFSYRVVEGKAEGVTPGTKELIAEMSKTIHPELVHSAFTHACGQVGSYATHEQVFVNQGLRDEIVMLHPRVKDEPRFG